MPELDDILAAEQGRLEADPYFYPYGEPDQWADPPSSRTSSEAYDTAVTVAVALEQDGVELRRLLRHIHRRSPEPLYRGPEEGPEDLCDAGCGLWPCATRFLTDGDEDVAEQIRAEILAEDIARMRDASG
jgi:hypothetical protein